MEGLEKAKEKALNEYIKQMRTQEECIGFIDGFNKAIEYANQQNNQWVSVEERPLIKIDVNGNWICTDDGDKEFIAAVETNKGWWIRHCVIEDEIGLCVVGDDYNEPSGWGVEDVTYYQPLPEPPKH